MANKRIFLLSLLLFVSLSSARDLRSFVENDVPSEIQEEAVEHQNLELLKVNPQEDLLLDEDIHLDEQLEEKLEEELHHDEEQIFTSEIIVEPAVEQQPIFAEETPIIQNDEEEIVPLIEIVEPLVGFIPAPKEVQVEPEHFEYVEVQNIQNDEEEIVPSIEVVEPLVGIIPAPKEVQVESEYFENVEVQNIQNDEEEIAPLIEIVEPLVGFIPAPKEVQVEPEHFEYVEVQNIEPVDIEHIAKELPTEELARNENLPVETIEVEQIAVVEAEPEAVQRTSPIEETVEHVEIENEVKPVKSSPLWYFGPVEKDPPSGRFILPPVLQFDLPDLGDLIDDTPINDFVVAKLEALQVSIANLLTALDA